MKVMFDVTNLYTDFFCYVPMEVKIFGEFENESIAVNWILCQNYYGHSLKFIAFFESYVWHSPCFSMNVDAANVLFTEDGENTAPESPDVISFKQPIPKDPFSPGKTWNSLCKVLFFIFEMNAFLYPQCQFKDKSFAL